MLNKENNPSYYAIIPSIVRYDKDLTPNAKLLYGEIITIINEKGYCSASNEYFSNLYKKDKLTISRWISQLTKKGYIINKLREDGRRIYLNHSKVGEK